LAFSQALYVLVQMNDSFHDHFCNFVAVDIYQDRFLWIVYCSLHTLFWMNYTIIELKEAVEYILPSNLFRSASASSSLFGD